MKQKNYCCKSQSPRVHNVRVNILRALFGYTRTKGDIREYIHIEYIHTYIHTHTLTHTHTHTNTQTHTQAHAHIHIHLQIHRRTGKYVNMTLILKIISCFRSFHKLREEEAIF